MKKFYKEFTNKLVNEPTAFKQSLKIIRTSINKTSLLFISLSAVFLLFTAYSLLPTNFSFAQTCSPGQNCSAINIDTTNNNLAIGTSSTQTDTKLLIVGTSTTNGYFAIKVLNLNTGPLFIVRSDGSVTIGSNLALTSQQGTATGTISGVGTPPTNGSLYVNGPIFTTLDLKASGIAVGTTTPQSGGNILATGIITGTNLGGTVPASNVTAGTFSDAANYYFQSGLGVGTTTASLGRLQIDDTANTGIYINGNSSGNAQTELYIDRNSSGSGILTGPNIRLNDHTATDANVIQNSQGALTFWNYGSNSWLERMRIASSGNVGIGTTAPNSQLTISGATGETTAAINTTGPQPGTLLIADTGSVAGNGGQIIFAADGGANSAWQFAGIKGLVNNGTASSTGDLAFATRHATGDAAFTEDMRIIGTTGNLAIATTSAASTLTVQGTAFVSGALTVGSCTGCGGGITSLNGLSGASQTFATSSGSGFNITSSGSTHTFQYDSDIIQIATLAPTKGNLVVGNGSWAALAVGANNKALMASSTATNGVSWESVPGGSGTTNSVPLWSAGTTLGNSLITQPGASAINIGSGGLGVGTTTAQTTGNIYATGNITAAGSLVGTFAGTVAAANVTAGLFNGGNYYFPSGLGVNTSTAGTLPVSGGLNVYGGGYFQNGVMINRPNLIGSTDLSVSGNTTNGEAIGFIGGDRGWIIGQGGTEFPVGGIGFRDTFASSTRMVIDSSGNVGIGTTTAASALNVYTSSGESAVNIEAPRYPKVYFKGDGGGTDAKLWQMYADTGSATTTNVFLLAALNDAGAGQSIAMRVSRTANVINYVDFPAGTVWADGGTNALPTAAGSSLTETALRVSGGAAAASIDFGSAGSVPAGWIQARNSTNYALNYAILLNPNGGNVGIGDSSPSTKLEVAGNVSSTGLCLGGTCNTAWPNSSQWTTSGSNIYYSTGNVGIGTSTPAAKLHVDAASGNALILTTASTNNHLTFRNAAAPSTNIWSQYLVGNDMRFYDYTGTPGDRVTFQSGGNVGIGTSTPAYALDVNGTIRGTSLIGSFAGTVPASNVTQGKFADAGSYYFQSSLGVATTSAGTLPQALSVYGGGYIRDYLEINNPSQLAGRLDVRGGATDSANLMNLVNSNYGSGTGSALSLGFGASSGNTYASISAGVNGWTGWGNLVFQNGGGNVGIGTTGPVAKLDVGGITTAPGGAPVIVGTAGSGVRSTLFVTDKTTGSGWLAGGGSVPTSLASDVSLNFKTGVVYATGENDATKIRMTIDTSGNVGIGTTGPGFPLTVGTALGNTNAQFGSGSPVYIISNDPIIGFNTYYNGGYIYGSTSGASSIDGDAGGLGNIVFYTAPSGTGGTAATLTERMRINQGGNVGIGDSSPSTKLEVAGNVSSTGLCLGGTCNTAWPNSSQWTTSGSNIYYSTGNVSVGTSTTNVAAFQVNAPAKHGLYVSGNSSANVVHDIYIHRDSSGTGIATGPNIRFEDGTANDNIVIQNSQGNLTFWNYGAGSWQEKMRMDSSGNLGIGMTPTHKLDVLGDILASRGDGSGAIYFGSSGGYVIGGTGGSMQVTAGGTNQNITLAPSGTGYTLLNGNVGVGTTAPGAKLNLLGGSLLVGTTTLANAVYTIQNGDGSADTRALFASSNPWSIKVQQGAGNGGYYVGATAAAAPDLIFSNQAGTERMRITDAGNVGIGTTGPSAALDVRGYAMFARGNSIQFADAGGLNRRNLARFLTTADTIVFGDTDNSGQAPVNFVFMPNTGGVGIGTSTPAYPLHVYSTSTAYILADFQSSNANGANIALSQTGTANGNKYIRSQGGNLDVINNAYTAAILSVSDAGNLTVGSGGTGSLNVGNVTLKGATSNTIFYGTVGVAAPGAGSAGEKIQLYGTAGTIGAADYALGIQGSNMWLNSGGGYVWYYNSTTIMSLSTAGTLTVGNGGVGKVTAGTFDPVYTIGGKNYATYLPGMTGVKEETTGVADLACSGGTCFYSINFSKLEKGSDLWLFWQATDFGKNMENLVALLTPSFDGRVWYQKDAAANILTIFGSSAGEVSYRLTANRFDSAQWPNASADSAAGLTPPEK